VQQNAARTYLRVQVACAVNLGDDVEEEGQRGQKRRLFQIADEFPFHELLEVPRVHRCGHAVHMQVIFEVLDHLAETSQFSANQVPSEGQLGVQPQGVPARVWFGAHLDDDFLAREPVSAFNYRTLRGVYAIFGEAVLV